jgi:uncharacterized repeat protein (TIGR01451 family)
VKTVILQVVLAGALAGQLPPLPDTPGSPGLPAPPIPMNLVPEPGPVPHATESKPPALVPINLGPKVDNRLPQPPDLPAGVRQDDKKPLPLKMIEVPTNNGTSTSLKPAPIPTPAPAPEPLPPGGVATPCLMLQCVGPANIKGGQPFCYDLVVHNIGTVAAPSARLENELPAGTRLVSAQPAPVVQGDRLVWHLENIAPGSERRLKVEVEATRDGDWKAPANLTVTATAAMQTSITGVPAPAVVVQAVVLTTPPTVTVGHPVAVPIKVTNITAAPLTDAVLRVQMSPGLQHLCGNAIEGPLGELLPGQSKEVLLDAVCAQTGRLTVDASLLSGGKVVAGAQAVLTASDQPVLTLRQTGPLTPPVGSEYDFKLEVVNRSGAEVRNLVLADTLPEGLQFLSGDVGGVYEPATRTIRWAVPVLAPGQSRQLQFRAAVRGAGAQLNRVSCRAAGVQDALLYTILRVPDKTP